MHKAVAKEFTGQDKRFLDSDIKPVGIARMSLKLDLEFT
jgi:hypothetical protein